MKKVKQMFRVTVARLAGPHFKIISHHKNIIHFGKVVKAFPKYFPTAQTLAYPPAEEAVKAQQQEAFQSDKLGLLNLVSLNAGLEEHNLGDFQGVNTSNFMHALRIPKQEIDFSELSLSNVETVNTEVLSNSDLFTLKLQAKKVKGRQGRPLERTHQRVKNITQNLRVINMEDVVKELRRSYMGTPLVLAK